MELTTGTATVKAPAQNFTGDMWMTPLKKHDPESRLIASLTRFTPGARTHWHSHVHGQALYCTEGEGLVVNRAGQVVRLRAGDTVWTAPGEEHWHGGTSGSMMCHVAMLVGDETADGTAWLEPVADEEYAAAHHR